jgi:Holliday junction resolvase RusA-like endonuclease
VIEISVRGIPAPKGSKNRGKNGGVYESSKAVGPWTDAVRGETQRAVTQPLTGPVSVRIWFFLRRPQGHYRTGKFAHLLRDAAPLRPHGTPDLDKLARAVLDGLTQGGAWKDDGQVADLDAGKFYALATGTPGCKIWIEEITE